MISVVFQVLNIQGIDFDHIIHNLPFYGEAHSLVSSLLETIVGSNDISEKEEAIEELNVVMVEHFTVALTLQEAIKVAREHIDV